LYKDQNNASDNKLLGVHWDQPDLAWDVQAVYEQAVEQKDRVAQGRALWQLGSVLGDQGQFKNAEVPLRDALALLESELGSDHLDIAKACNGMPLLYTPLF